MHETNLRKLDLNLLVTLNALLEERHVTNAADRVNLSQPAMSRALSRLRDMFEDPLLVKGAGGMVLTVRASELYQPLQNILREITHLISPPPSDPAATYGEIIIATRDYELATILPNVIRHLAKKAPNLKLSVIPFIGDDLRILDNHKIDFVIAGTDSESATLHRSILYNENFVCLVSKDNSVMQTGLDLNTYISMKHCLVTIKHFGVGLVDHLLSKLNLRRDIVVRIPNFLAVPHVIANTSLITTLPRRLGELHARDDNIALLNPPFNIKDFPIYLYWHKRNHLNPLHQWIKQVIRDSISQSHLW